MISLTLIVFAPLGLGRCPKNPLRGFAPNNPNLAGSRGNSQRAVTPVGRLFLFGLDQGIASLSTCTRSMLAIRASWLRFAAALVSPLTVQGSK